MRLRVDMLARALGDGAPELSAGFTDTSENYTSFNNVRIEHSVLFQIVRHGILREQRRLHTDLGANPFALCMRLGGRVFAAATRSELRTERSALDLIELLKIFPGLVAASSGDIDFELYDSHHAANHLYSMKYTSTPVIET
jgi:hypothetical protein